MARVETRTLICALLCVFLAFGWQFLTVHKNYGGDWTALFCAGSTSKMPPVLSKIYRFPDSSGFDGAIYLVMAHDPLMRNGYAAFVDDPGLRYRRILVPALAYAAAFGQSTWIPSSYILVNLCFLFAGVWWSSRYAVLQGRSPFWGALFLLLPATLISLDRMTVDMAFAAVAVGALYYCATSQDRKLFCALLLLCLVRETGVIICGAFGIYYLRTRQWRNILKVAAAVAPLLIWTVYVNLRFKPDIMYWMPVAPFVSTVKMLLHPVPYNLSPLMSIIVRSLDILALAAIAVAFAQAFRLRHALPIPLRLANWFFAALGMYLFALDDWTHVYDFGRLLTPMLMLTVMGDVLPSRRWLALVPTAVITGRVAVQLAPQVLGVLSGG